MRIIKVINSTLPIIIKQIKETLAEIFKFEKLKSWSAYKLELTVFIIVSKPSLMEFSNLIPDKDNKKVIVVKEITKIKILKKYLFITS